MADEPRTPPGLMALSLLVAIYALYAAAFVAHSGALVAYPFDVDQGEGYDVNSAWLIAQGRWIYADNERWPYYSSNYPPVYSLVLAPLLALGGPSLGLGRLVSALATGGIALLIAAAVRRETGSPLAAVLAGALFLASPYVYHTAPLARVNALTEFLALAGLLCCFHGKARSVSAGALLLGLAVLAKPTAGAVALVGLIYAARLDRRTGLTALFVSTAVGGVVVLALEWASGGHFLVNVVQGNVNPWEPWRALAYWGNFALVHVGVIALAVAAFAWRTGNRFWLYALAGLPTVLGVGKWGAGDSYFLTLAIALSVLAGCAIGRAGSSPLAMRLSLACLALQAVLFLHEPLIPGGLSDLGPQARSLGTSPRPADAQVGYELVALIGRSPGPVLSEDPAFALVGGREVVGNATHLRNLHEAGLWRGERLVADIDSRRFSFVLLDAQLYPEPVLQAVGRSYYLWETVMLRGTEHWIFAPGALLAARDAAS